MPSTASLIVKLRTDFPQFQFTPGSEFRWAPHETTVYYKEDSTDSASLLHELSHALLEHRAFTRDIQLIIIEQTAWHHAQKVLGPLYAVEIRGEQVEDSLDTYRDWLHARSTCPTCTATGAQIKQLLYSCVACHTKWKVNDARICELRRTVLHQKRTA